MEKEIELKLAVDTDPLPVLEQRLLPKLDANIHQSQTKLLNHYFDTPDRELRKNDFGFRVRSKQGKFEQTLKLAGKSIGGLHQRPEYNLPLDNEKPDLSQFAGDIWPAGISVSSIQQQLTQLFTTHFERRQFLLEYANGDQIELAIDIGEIAVGKQQERICEIELELKAGAVSAIFDLAEKIIQLLPARLDNLSKAARGYMLADGKSLVALTWPDYLPLKQKVSVASGLVKAIEHGFKHWQRHEQMYRQEQRPVDMQLMYRAISMLLRATRLYQTSMPTNMLKYLEQALQDYLSRWHWVLEFMALKALRSKKGHFRKRLGRQEDLLSYLRGRGEGLLQQHQPLEIIQSAQNQSLQMQISRLLVEQPWLQSDKEENTPKLQKQAAVWLTDGWNSIQNQLSDFKSFDAQKYLAVENPLRETMQNGYLLASLFQENREQFRAPWLDLLDGMQELTTLNQLKVELGSAEIEDLPELSAWCEEKIANLVKVMHQSHRVALKMEPYW